MVSTVQTSQLLAEEHGVPSLDYGEVVHLAVAPHSRRLGTLSTLSTLSTRKKSQ